jgi:hypothetical protein
MSGLRERMSTKLVSSLAPEKISGVLGEVEPYGKVLALAHTAECIVKPAKDFSELSDEVALTPTVFHEEWWLDAATDGEFAVAEVSSGGRVTGRLPYAARKRYGIRGIWTPPLTYFLGPGINAGEGSSVNRFLKQLDIHRELIDKLPRSSWQCIRCHGGVTDVIAFQERLFRTYAQFTHLIEPAPIDILWKRMRDKTRNVIRRANEQLTICDLDDPDEFIHVHEQNLERKGERNSLDLAACRRLLRATHARGRGRMIAARNGKNEIVAANFCAWDARTSFYILCTRSEIAGNGASSLLLWEAIKHAVGKNLVFDFAGMGTPGSILLYSGFGATVCPRYVAVRATGLGRLISEARSLFVREHFLF